MFCSDGLCFQGLRVVLLDSDGLASSCLRTGGLVVAWGLREHLSRNALFPPGGDDGRPAKRQQQRQHPPFFTVLLFSFVRFYPVVVEGVALEQPHDIHFQPFVS